MSLSPFLRWQIRDWCVFWQEGACSSRVHQYLQGWGDGDWISHASLLQQLQSAISKVSSKVNIQ